MAREADGWYKPEPSEMALREDTLRKHSGVHLLGHPQLDPFQKWPEGTYSRLAGHNVGDPTGAPEGRLWLEISADCGVSRVGLPAQVSLQTTTSFVPGPATPMSPHVTLNPSRVQLVRFFSYDKHFSVSFLKIMSYSEVVKRSSCVSF